MNGPDDATEVGGDLGQDPVGDLREELATITSLSVPERVARFERANEVLASALADLDEV